MRLLTLSLIFSFFVFSGCSKQKSVPSPSAAENKTLGSAENRILENNAPEKNSFSDLCPPGQIARFLKTVNEKEAERNDSEKTAKSAPAKENFKKLYEAELSLTREVNDAIRKLSECGTAPASETLADLRRKTAESVKNTAYLSASFPDFKSKP